MTRKKREKIKKQNLVITAFENVFSYAKKNLRLFIIGLIIFIVAVSGVYAYQFYDKRQDNKVQHMLSQGIQSFEAYSINGSKEDLDNAEIIFKNVISTKRKQLSVIAMLYLGKINYMRGQNDEARKLYEDLMKSSSDPVLKTLVGKALEHINKK